MNTFGHVEDHEWEEVESPFPEAAAERRLKKVKAIEILDKRYGKNKHDEMLIQQVIFEEVDDNGL